MKIPLQVSFHGLTASDALETLCREKVAKLERFHGRITSCRVVLGEPNKRHEKGNPVAIHIHLELPGGQIEVKHEAAGVSTQQGLHVALNDAFHATRRRLQDFARKQAGRTKTHRTPARGASTARRSGRRASGAREASKRR